MRSDGADLRSARMEREILDAIDIAHPDGRLRRDAVGWARHPIHRCNLESGLGRVHRWNYWCITSREIALTLLVADVGIAGTAFVSFLDYAGNSPVERIYVRPGRLPIEMPAAPRGDIVLEVPRLRLALKDRGEHLYIEVDARTLLGGRIVVDLTVARPFAHETLNVLVPFDDERFQFTSKQQALTARGSVRVGRREYRFDADNQGFACLDFGRGRWPRGIEWNWAFGSAGGKRSVGLNLGGKWTDGTGVTENGVVVDGRVHKIADAVDFTYDTRAYRLPWRIRTRATSRVDLQFAPRRERALKVPLGLACLELHQMMGAFSGTVIDDAGEPIVIDDMVGLAESLSARW